MRPPTAGPAAKKQMISRDEFQPSYSLFQDWQANRGSAKSRFILVFFRLAYFLRNRHRLTHLAGLPLLVLYRVCVEWFLGVEIPHKTKVGPGLRLLNGYGLVINDDTVIGSHCTLRETTTLGNKQEKSGAFSRAPLLGDQVDVGSHSVIIGPITIGDQARIAVGSVVLKDVPARASVAGNPAKQTEDLSA